MGGTNSIIKTIAWHDIIGGGFNNQITSTSYDGIFSGCDNSIFSASNYSFIGGGRNNHIGSTCWQGYGVIAGGRDNTTAGGTGFTAQFSAILGGCNNTVNHDFAGIFGCGITSVANNTFHVECLNAVNTPTGVAGLPSGTIVKVSGAPPMGALPLYIMP